MLKSLSCKILLLILFKWKLDNNCIFKMKKFTLNQLFEQLTQLKAKAEKSNEEQNQGDWEYEEVIQGIEKINAELKPNESVRDYIEILKNELKIYFKKE